jgi:NAD(P)-dependent dehydrogenase (short-subunit alcohol dehydrogenase family)
MNLALRLSIHTMQSNPVDSSGARGSIVLVASTSGYFGGTGVVSYVASKHGVVGLARASQPVAKKLGIRINVVAPSLTPTFITAGFAKEWKERGLPANTVEDVADAIVVVSADPERKGQSVMVSLIMNNAYLSTRTEMRIQVAGSVLREIELKRAALTNEWLGEDIVKMMSDSGKFFDDIGGYKLPEVRS